MNIQVRMPAVFFLDKDHILIDTTFGNEDMLFHDPGPMIERTPPIAS